MKRNRINPGVAWIIMCVVFAIHVADEALNDFLSVYNPAVTALRQQAPFLPVPVFTFTSWIILLIAALTALFALSPWAFRRARWMRPLSCLFGILMCANGLLHIGGTILSGRAIPGVCSSPLLCAGAVYLLLSQYRSGGTASPSEYTR